MVYVNACKLYNLAHILTETDKRFTITQHYQEYITLVLAILI